MQLKNRKQNHAQIWIQMQRQIPASKYMLRVGGEGGVAGGAEGLLKEMLFPQRKAEYLHLARGKFSGGSINQFLKI